MFYSTISNELRSAAACRFTMEKSERNNMPPLQICAGKKRSFCSFGKWVIVRHVLDILLVTGIYILSGTADPWVEAY